MEFKPVGDQFPLEKADMLKLPPPGFKAASNECYVLTWSWRGRYTDEQLIRGPVIKDRCGEGYCVFGMIALTGYCLGRHVYNIGAPVLCSDGKEDFVTHVVDGTLQAGLERECTEFIAIELDKFIPDIKNKTGYKRPGQSFCPVC